MHGYKETSFQNRVALSQSAKTKALALLLARAPLSAAQQKLEATKQATKDEALIAKSARTLAMRNTASAQKTAEKVSKREQEVLALKAATQPKADIEADQKSARDLRYAARKARKSRN